MNLKKLLWGSASALALATAFDARAVQLWDWRYSAAGIAAAGTFTTGETADASGFYSIVGITGARNGVAITGLQPTGTAIPGNEPYAVDNLVATAGPQLSGDGFGFALADGSYANPFFVGTGYDEYLSAPPYPAGLGSEVTVTFSATPVPEPATEALLLLGLGALSIGAHRRRETAACTQ